MNPEDPDALAELSRHAQRSEAEERGLVLLSLGIEYWILRRDGQNALCVEERNCQAAMRELEDFEAERETHSPPHEQAGFAGKTTSVSLFVFGWVIAMFFLIQQLAPAGWMEKGDATSDAIMRGEWWRAITALTLHADVEHIVANIATGLVFSAFLVPLLGPGVAWFSIVLSGVFGNLLNAWFYRRESHASIGASTAVFGALGILVAWQVTARVLAIRKFRAWELIVPVGAGLALLGYLGAGDAQARTDFMAHFWGFVAGAVLGAGIAGLRLEKRTTPAMQRVLAVVAVTLPVAGWLLAMKR